MIHLRARIATAPRQHLLPGWLPAVLLLAGTALAGPSTGQPARIAFVLACGIVGLAAWRRGPESHLQSAIVLFAFTPFVRRLVDLGQGYDALGLMLTGPLLAIAAPLADLARPVPASRGTGSTYPAASIVVAGCAVYAAALSFLQGDVTNAASGALKWGAPIIYGAVLYRRARLDPDRLVQAAASAFAAILPVMGLYGILQYVDPPAWDRLWLQYAPITSAGLPRPFAVRTFSTMNSPASFATFTATGLVLLAFLRPGWQSLLLGAPAILSLLLSSYRTAWLSLAAAILFCLLFQTTRLRAVVIAAGTVLALFAAVAFTPFGSTIATRLATFERAAEDDSGRERLEQFSILWNQPSASRALLGTGFTAASDGSGSQMATDGMIITCWLTMGFFVGLLCLIGLIAAAVHAIGAAMRHPRIPAITIGALGVGALVQLPLANIASGELGFLFWTMTAMAATAASVASKAQAQGAPGSIAALRARAAGRLRRAGARAMAEP